MVRVKAPVNPFSGGNVAERRDILNGGIRKNPQPPIAVLAKKSKPVFSKVETALMDACKKRILALTVSRNNSLGPGSYDYDRRKRLKIQARQMIEDLKKPELQKALSEIMKVWDVRRGENRKDRFHKVKAEVIDLLKRIDESSWDDYAEALVQMAKKLKGMFAEFKDVHDTLGLHDGDSSSEEPGGGGADDDSEYREFRTSTYVSCVRDSLEASGDLLVAMAEEVFSEEEELD